MSEIKETFGNAKNVMQFTSDPASRVLGGLVKVATVGTFAVIAANAAPLVIGASLIAAGAVYAGAASAQAGSITTIDPTGKTAGTTQPVKTYLYPGKF